jgi:bifunctional DNA-binding transcriptional regulator/antitoxin component of YhaV-PrlF toxin-antitoxin module
MPKINGNNKIVVPPEIVERMNGHPGDEVIFIEEIDPFYPGDNTLKTSRTYRLNIMLKSVWDEECKKIAQGKDSFIAAKILDEEELLND